MTEDDVEIYLDPGIYYVHLRPVDCPAAQKTDVFPASKRGREVWVEFRSVLDLHGHTKRIVRDFMPKRVVFKHGSI